MSKANVDPVELRRFAHDLNRFNGELQTLMSGLHAKLSGLEATWRDQEHEKFAREFTQTAQVLSQFVGAANEHIPFLLRKAERIEEYLQQR